MTTHMIELRLDALHLMRLAHERKLPRREVDLGYLTHCQLGELFGDAAPRPFAILSHPGRDPLAAERELRVLGYASTSAVELDRRAREGARPGRYNAVDWQRLASKPMPETWPTGRRLAFEVRACPVARMASNGPHHRRGAEVDVFLRECWRAGEGVPVDREAVYRGWLTKRLAHQGAVANDVRVDGMQITPVVRRDHEPVRTSRRIRRPDVRFSGVLEITDGERFATGLSSGIGRHRAFGFGMLLLKPAT